MIGPQSTGAAAEHGPTTWQQRLRKWSGKADNGEDRMAIGTVRGPSPPPVSQEVLVTLGELRMARDAAGAAADFHAARSCESRIERIRQQETAKQLQELLLRHAKEVDGLEERFQGEFDRWAARPPTPPRPRPPLWATTGSPRSSTLPHRTPPAPTHTPSGRTIPHHVHSKTAASRRTMMLRWQPCRQPRATSWRQWCSARTTSAPSMHSTHTPW